MATYKLKRKNFGLFSPFAKTAANWTAALGAGTFLAAENKANS